MPYRRLLAILGMIGIVPVVGWLVRSQAQISVHQKRQGRELYQQELKSQSDASARRSVAHDEKKSHLEDKKKMDSKNDTSPSKKSKKPSQ